VLGKSWVLGAVIITRRFGNSSKKLSNLPARHFHNFKAGLSGSLTGRVITTCFGLKFEQKIPLGSMLYFIKANVLRETRMSFLPFREMQG
jgi:hypothetical protein